ncbi:MAG: hypothetical protein K2X77_00745 [Candidatus Obscuribacterales bacterium]|jgi:hypothetical protein|nr:hypothetical protein [Candidatus Obscuribacterales bacterium]
MQDLKSRLLAILFAVTALNLLCFFEIVQPANALGSDFNTNRIRQAAKACLSAAISVFEKNIDDKGNSLQRDGNGGGELAIGTFDLSFRSTDYIPEGKFKSDPIFAQRKLWLLNRALLI